jgi:branched-chain amino acid transport system permease protein
VGAVALSLVLIFKATRVINFAQGSMAMFGTFVAYTAFSQWSLPLWAAVILAMLISAAAAAVIERVLIRPFDPANHMAITLVTLALYLALGATAALIWGFNPRGFPTLFPDGPSDFIPVAGARLLDSELGTAVVVVTTVAVLALLLTRTRIGLAFRCVSSSIENSRLVGINVGRTVQASWAIAAAVGTLAGCLVAPTTYLEPSFTNNILIYAFAAATFGGLDSIGGALVGGLVVDLSISLITGYIPALGSEFDLAAAFIVIILVLQFKPAGLFGRRQMERV